MISFQTISKHDYLHSIICKAYSRNEPLNNFKTTRSHSSKIMLPFLLACVTCMCVRLVVNSTNTHHATNFQVVTLTKLFEG